MDLIRVLLPRIDPVGKAIGMKPVTTFQPDTLGFIIPLLWAVGTVIGMKSRLFLLLLQLVFQLTMGTTTTPCD